MDRTRGVKSEYSTSEDKKKIVYGIFGCWCSGVWGLNLSMVEWEKPPS